MNVEERVKLYIDARESIRQKAKKDLKELDDSYVSEIAEFVPIKVGDIIEYTKRDIYGKSVTKKGLVSKIDINTSGGYSIMIHPTKLNGQWSKRETYFGTYAIYVKPDIKVIGHDDNSVKSNDTDIL